MKRSRHDCTRFTELLNAARRGSPSAEKSFRDLVYSRLQRLARQQMAGDFSVRRVMRATSLAHEAWIELAGRQDPPWEDRVHFCRTVAKIMRHIRCDSARKILKGKNGGAKHLPLDGVAAAVRKDAMDTLAIEEALKELHRSRPRAAQVVEWRYFGGFKVQETAMALGVSPGTVESDWAFARAWLHRKLGQR